MKNQFNYIIVTLLFLSAVPFAQVKIGDNPTTIGDSSALELESTNKALLITRVATTASVVSPVNGMLVYDISSSCVKSFQNGAWTLCLGYDPTVAVLTQIGSEGDSPNVVTSVVTAAQINTIVPSVTGVIVANQSTYQVYIDAYPNNFSVPATQSQVQAMVNAGNTSANVLMQIGNEGDSPNTISSIVTVAQINTIVPPITGAIVANQSAYQAYVDANPNTLSAPATPTEVQALVSLVNTSILSSNGTALVASYTCSKASSGLMIKGIIVSNVTQTITATVTTAGTYNISVTANGVTFAGSGTFAGTGERDILLTASGTPTTQGLNSFSLNTSPNCSFDRSTYLPLPAGITLASISPYFVVSIYDQNYLPYSLPTTPATLETSINPDGTNDPAFLSSLGRITTTGVTIKIPYTASGTINLLAFTQTIAIPALYTHDGNGRNIEFSYSATSISTNTGFIQATLKSKVGDLYLKQLDLQTGIGNDYLGWLVAQFIYPSNSTGGTANFAVRDIAAIPDRNIADVNHRMFYLPVIATDGNIWLTNNLGANYSNIDKSTFTFTFQANTYNDYRAYGSLFQWGRFSDGHELINWTSNSSGTGSGISSTLSTTQTPNNTTFYTNSISNYDWLSAVNSNLWQGETGTNNPCPIGFRLPTNTEMDRLVSDSMITTQINAASSTLKIPSSGSRYVLDGNISGGTQGIYWTSSTSGLDSNFRSFFNGGTGNYSGGRGNGYSVRCIRD
jgi:uncharacterized protein (TIGR02145 family)